MLARGLEVVPQWVRLSMGFSDRPIDLGTRGGAMPQARVRAGTGVSRLESAFEAGKAATALAVAPLAGEPPALVLVFTTPRYDLPALLAGIRSVAGSALLLGATGSGEIVHGEYLGFGAGVGVLAMTAGPYRFGAASASHIRDDMEGAAQQIARASRAQAGDSPFAAVLLLADSLLGDLQELVTGFYKTTGPKVPLVGGGAGDEQRFLRTLVFHGDQILEQAAVALWIASDQPLRVVTRHGWDPIGRPLFVTRAEGTKIQELDGRPAAEVYEEQLGLEPGQLDPDRFWDTSILHPFGLMQTDGTFVIRVARSKNMQGELKIQGCLPPPGCGVQVMTGSPDSLLGVVEEVVGTSLGARRDATVLLTFSCAARAMILGKRAPEEARRLQLAAGDVPTFGFCCCAEFARSSGTLGTHNATLTAVAL
jgi:hypothetical protein